MADDEAHEWIRVGSAVVRHQLEILSDEALEQPSLLPGWSRRTVIAHLISNAWALRRLTLGGLEGTGAPMYLSEESRLAEIGAATHFSRHHLVNQLAHVEEVLSGIWSATPPTSLNVEVRTRMGRRISLRELPWLRSRELWIHAVDLDGSLRWANVPVGLLTRLIDDIAQWRSLREDGPAVRLCSEDAYIVRDIRGSGSNTIVIGTCADLASYLTGRGSGSARTTRGNLPPELPPWL